MTECARYTKVPLYENGVNIRTQGVCRGNDLPTPCMAQEVFCAFPKMFIEKTVFQPKPTLQDWIAKEGDY